jgi:hypothetical protein
MNYRHHVSELTERVRGIQSASTAGCRLLPSEVPWDKITEEALDIRNRKKSFFDLLSV